MHLWRPHRIILAAASPKIIHLLAQLALLKYQSLQGGVKDIYAKEEIEGALIQGKVRQDCVWPRWRLEDHLAKFYEKIFRASSAIAIVSPTAETGRGILHKELKLRIRPGKYCMVLATRDGGERRPCFITRFLKLHATISSTANLRKSKHVEVIIAEVLWLEDHPSKGFFGSDTHVWRKTTEPSSPRSSSTVIHSAGRRSTSMWSCIRHKNIETWPAPPLKSRCSLFLTDLNTREMYVKDNFFYIVWLRNSCIAPLRKRLACLWVQPDNLWINIGQVFYLFDFFLL